MSNLEIWERFADIDPKFTKGITGKDYSGTSPNAHYVIRCLTELFGPVGQGFGWRVVAESIDHFGDTAIHWCRIEFWHTGGMTTNTSLASMRSSATRKSRLNRSTQPQPATKSRRQSATHRTSRS